MSNPTREVELKARVHDLHSARRNIEGAGAVLVFEGSLRDRLYDTAGRSLAAQDFVLRLRSYRTPLGSETAHIDWKGPTSREGGFKVRAELTTGVTDAGALDAILERLGYAVVGEIDREIAQYELTYAAVEGATCVVVRFERYPRMDTLVEVEGRPAAIEHAIAALGLPRESFSAARLTEFVRAFEARTGERAAICDAAL